MIKSYSKHKHQVYMQWSKVNQCYFIRHRINGNELPPELHQDHDQAQARYREIIAFIEQMQRAAPCTIQ